MHEIACVVPRFNGPAKCLHRVQDEAETTPDIRVIDVLRQLPK
ncbi:MAG TPA: hypothetical protein VKR52_13285 [Terracidiphilus sp.]|nr:hypothetical protein [Terracidiphilus sp.]